MKNNLDFVIGVKEARSLKVNSEKINQMVQETLQYVYSEIRRVAHVKTKLLFTYDVCFNAYENIPFLFPESVDKIISNDIKLENIVKSGVINHLKQNGYIVFNNSLGCMICWKDANNKVDLGKKCSEIFFNVSLSIKHLAIYMKYEIF